ncbi:formylglycine-generating enzyme family protein [Kitasatospora sp. NPDC091335]|uniref:formylglycine-generating enzyme family protein n=1 Tax=Kitasatospora sp. NPDC091335 TaxID=3364085 RepID=UPI0038204947
MITVPSGRVTLSDRRTQQSWAVDVASYELAACPVTREQYEGATGDRRPAHSVSWLDAVHYCNELSRREGRTPAYAADGEDVSWDRTADGYRLPTEAEWEHACRAGTEGPRYGPLDEIAWYRGNSDERPHEVGGLRPNAHGLHDLLGNVWEWCWDRYDPAVYGDYRVLRGGGWFDEHWSCRASVRRRSHPTLRIDDVGFRLARSLSGGSAGAAGEAAAR